MEGRRDRRGGREPGELLADPDAALERAHEGHAAAHPWIDDGPVPDRRRDGRALLSPQGRRRLRVRPDERPHPLWRVREALPREQRACRPGDTRPHDAAVGRADQGDARLKAQGLPQLRGDLPGLTWAIPLAYPEATTGREEPVALAPRHDVHM